MVPLATVAVIVVTVVAIAGLASAVDVEQLRSIARVGRDRPVDAAMAVVAFLAAFALRAALWSRMTAGLRFGQSFAAIGVATGANHILPFRLGEPLRVVSAARRTAVRTDDILASTVALRVGDVLALFVIAAVVGPTVTRDVIGWWAIPLAMALVGVAVIAIRMVNRAAGRLSTPDLVTVAGVFAAWLLEAVLVWRIASWAEAGVTYRDAVLVGTIAVAAQLVAIAPGGFGTYEAAAIAALVATGVDVDTAAAIALSVHAVKTVLALTYGAVSVVAPRPNLIGRWRLPRTVVHRQPDELPDGHVALFLPAFNEGPRVAEVIRRAPTSVCGRRVEVLVIDDGSSDGTVAAARDTGAIVIQHPTNRGLGAAVATGFKAAVERGAAVVAFCDADLEYDPAELERLVDPIITGAADYVVGSRFAGQIDRMRPHRRFGNWVLTRWVAWMARAPITDGQSGYRALSQAAAAGTVSGHDYNYAQVLTLDLIRRGFRYHEIPIHYRFRQSGDSFVRLGTYLRRCVPAAWRVINRPLTTEDGRGSVLDDVGVESFDRGCPGGRVPSAGSERVDGVEGHVDHMMEVVGHDQTLASE